MPTVEIDEIELRNLNTIKNTVDTIIRHPKARKLVEQARKIVDPNAVTPALDAEAEQNAPLTELSKTVSDLRKQIEDDKAEREKNAKLSSISNTINEEKAALRRAGWTDDGLKKVDEIMEKKGILSPLDAATIYERDNPPALPATPSGSGNWNFIGSVGEGEADLKKLIETRGESSSLIDKMAREALNEVRGASRR